MRDKISNQDQSTSFSRFVDEGINTAKKVITKDVPKAFSNLQQGAKDTWQGIVDPSGKQAKNERIKDAIKDVGKQPQASVTLMKETRTSLSEDYQGMSEDEIVKGFTEYIQNIPSQESN